MALRYAFRAISLLGLGKALGGGMFIDRHQVGQDVLTREQIIEQISEGPMGDLGTMYRALWSL